MRKFYKYFFSVLAILLLVLIFGGLWLYSGTLTQAKAKVFEKLPLPMALVNGQPILMKDFLFRSAIAGKILGSQLDQQTKNRVGENILNELIGEQEIGQLAARRNLVVNQKDIDREYLAQTKLLEGQGKNLAQSLGGYGMDQNFFKNQVIEPRLLSDKLQIWFNSQASLNTEAYDQAAFLLGQIQNGADISKLASKYSQSDSEKKVSGDLGFVQDTDLTDELQEAVDSLKIGETKIIPSRYGLHVIRLEEKNGNQLHLREIFLNTSDFDAWLKSQTQNFKIKKLITI